MDVLTVVLPINLLPRKWDGGFAPPPTVPITHHLRPAKENRRIRDELGFTCSASELPRHLEPEAGLEPAATSLSAITQSCDPSKDSMDK